MDPTNAPESWDQHLDGESSDKDGLNDATKGIQGLNVNAAPFIPGQNVFAKEFVPSFAATNQTTPQFGSQEENTANATSNGNPGPEKMEEDDAPDDWAEKADSNSSTPDDSGGGGAIGGCGDTMDTGNTASPDEEKDEEDSDESEDADSRDISPSSDIPHVTKPKKKTKPEASQGKAKDHLNIVFIGHVDAGKSTIGGHIMYLTGMVDKRTLEKYEREAKEKNRESWYLSWALDTNLEERDKGKTVEVGRAYFETDTKHFTILDAPGHKSFVPNMIGGASQADCAVLVISARRGEFETGFERGGQTREHAMLVKTAGVKHLIVVVNKMDDPTVEWDETRYEEIKDKLTPYLKKCGFNPKGDIYYLPVSGLTGVNLKETNTESCPWYNGPSLIDYLDKLPPVSRMADGPIRMPVVDRYRDMGTIVLGKIESGSIARGQVLTLMPNKLGVEVMQLWSDEEEVEQCFPGANVKLKLKNVEEEDVSSGFVLCSPNSLCHTGRVFDAQVVILEHKSIICAGYSAVMHLHTCAEEVSIKSLLCTVDKKTGEKSKTRPRFIKQDQIAIVRLEVPGGLICLETFKEFPQMGRFTLRDENKTIGIGKVLKVIA